MLLEIVILLSIANIVFIVLIMKLCSCDTVKSKKAKVEEEEEYEDIQSEKELKPEPEKLKPKFRIAEKLHLKKKEVKRHHVSEMPDMNKVISELQSEFRKGSKKKEKHKKSKNDLQDRFEEIEKS
jgi:membrane-associated HD superfamily phosphohydrolase